MMDYQNLRLFAGVYRDVGARTNPHIRFQTGGKTIPLLINCLHHRNCALARAAWWVSQLHFGKEKEMLLHPRQAFVGSISINKLLHWFICVAV